MDTADEEGIPLQVSSYAVGGSTDGAVIHLHGTGVPAIVLAVPARHIHSHGAIIHKDDYENGRRLLTAIVKKLDQETVSGLTG